MRWEWWEALGDLYVSVSTENEKIDAGVVRVCWIEEESRERGEEEWTLEIVKCRRKV